MSSQSKFKAKDVASLSDLRKLANNAERAAFAHIHFKVGARDAKAYWNVGGGTFTRAVDALKDNRDVGVAGRPRRFNQEQEQVIVDYVLEQADKKECKSKSEVRQYVRCFSYLYIAIISISDM